MTATPFKMEVPRIEKSARFHQLDAIRGIAALAVVISHYTSVIWSDPALNMPTWNAVVSFFMWSPLGGLIIGLPAVLLFFVLSGFALTKMLQSSRDGYASYAVKRIARIWPPYLVSIALAVLFISTIGWASGEHISGWAKIVTGHPLNMGDILDHVLLLGAFEPHYNFVAWTLVYEMRISLIFPLVYITLLKWSPKQALLIYAGVSVVSVLLHYAAKKNGYPDLANWLATGHYTFFFVVGAVIALNLDFIIDWYHQQSFGLKILALMLAMISYTYPPQIRAFGENFSEFPMLLTHWLILPGISIFIVMAIGSSKLKNFLMRPSLQWLGKVSYSLYLFHPLVIFIVLGLWGQGLGVLEIAFIGIAVSLIVAAAAYSLVEKPSQKLGRFLAEKANPIRRVA